MNTVFALTGSCIFTFITSGIFNKGKYKMEDIVIYLEYIFIKLFYFFY